MTVHFFYFFQINYISYSSSNRCLAVTEFILHLNAVHDCTYFVCTVHPRLSEQVELNLKTDRSDTSMPKIQIIEDRLNHHLNELIV